MTRIAGVRKVEFTINASNPVDWGINHPESRVTQWDALEET